MDERVAKAIIDLDDPEIVIVNNGRVKSRVLGGITDEIVTPGDMGTLCIFQLQFQ